MPDETNTFIVRDAFEEDKDTSSFAEDVTAAEVCSAQCPTCQGPCEYTAGHAGLHHCEKGHDWI